MNPHLHPPKIKSVAMDQLPTPSPLALTDIVDKLHIIVGTNGVCMCGVNGKTCRDLLASVSEDVSKAILCNSFGGTRLEGQEEALEQLGREIRTALNHP